MQTCHFAQTDFRNRSQVFGIQQHDRRYHLYTLGRTGQGKSTLLENMAIADMRANGAGVGPGVCFIDPHGQHAEKLLDFVPSSATERLVYINPADTDYPVGLNIFDEVPREAWSLVAEDIVSLFVSMFSQFWGPNTEHILRNCIYALLEVGNATLLNVSRMVNDESYRNQVAERVKDPVVRQFWTEEFTSYNAQVREPALSPLRNKLGQFLTNPMVRHIIGQPKSTVNLREVMDNRGILIVNLSKGHMGTEASRFLGSLLVTKLVAAGMRRADTPEDDRPDFNIFLDEFQNFASTTAFPTALAECRKYHLAWHLSNQVLTMVDKELREAILGNVGTLITFRTGGSDAMELAREFWPTFKAEDIINLPQYSIYLKLLIDGVPSVPFSAVTLPPDQERVGRKDIMIAQSRRRYGTYRGKVEAKIKRLLGKE